ncbi:MAG: LacI family DNA-binding transcriptional regulator [Verrucomicrobia bacterium]|nr:LacI family DNA-binding transcriptional regulator [Verrucomicrobiota bacterium]
MKGRVTSHDIAREAGVARSTVSLVLTNNPKIQIPDATRKRILAAARKLGYVPNSAAQMLVSGRSRTVGLILSRPDLMAVDAFVPRMVFGINEGCRARGYRLLMETVVDPSNGDAYLELAKSKRIDGLIVINPRKGDVALVKLIESKFPVLIFGSCGHSAENAVGTKDGEASCRATEHLLALGRQRIAHISYAALTYLPASKRLEGYRAALKRAKIPFDRQLFAEGDFSLESGHAAMKRILASNARPAALFAGNDTIAIGAMAAIREAGLSIPEDIAVVGYDDLPAASFTSPPLTTVRSHAIEQGRRAGEALIALLEREAIGRQLDMVPLELIVRASCGAETISRKRNAPSVTREDARPAFPPARSRGSPKRR